MSRTHLISVLLTSTLLVVTAGCGDDDVDGSPDAAPPLPVDDAGDPLEDAGEGPGEDAGEGPGEDAGEDASETGFLSFNGCDHASAEDHTGSATVTVGIGAGNTYDPACLRVTQETAVTFEANVTHPASSDDEGDEWADSFTSETANVTRDMDQVGSFGFLCDSHAAVGMVGVVYVEPE